MLRVQRNGRRAGTAITREFVRIRERRPRSVMQVAFGHSLTVKMVAETYSDIS